MRRPVWLLLHQGLPSQPARGPAAWVAQA